jgi:hypothetical protein
MILAPTLLYFACSLVMPQQIDSTEFMMDEHFFQIRKPLFVSFAFTTLVVMVDGDVLGDEPLWHTGRIGNVAMLCFAIWGYLTTNKNAHRIVAVSILLIFVGLIAFRFWNPR